MILRHGPVLWWETLLREDKVIQKRILIGVVRATLYSDTGQLQGLETSLRKHIGDLLEDLNRRGARNLYCLDTGQL